MGIRSEMQIRPKNSGNPAGAMKAFVMNSEPWNVDSQLRQLQELRAGTRAAQQRAAVIEHQLRELDDREEEFRLQLQEMSTRKLQVQEDTIRSETESRRRDLISNYESHRDQLNRNAAARLRELEVAGKEATAAIRARLQNELWVLQSVCDENQEDTPVRQAERARGDFQTQQKWLEQRFAELDERVRLSAEYLNQCHAGMDAALPSPVVEAKSRDAARVQATDFADRAMIAAAAIDHPSLPQWILGWRILGLGLLVFLVISVFVTIARADISLFLNPLAGRPDWQWLGVASGIGGGLSFLTVMVLLSVVQSRLRGAFEELLQCVSNARALSEFWQVRSGAELKKLEAAAERWSADVQLRREQRAAGFVELAEAEILELEQSTDDSRKQEQEWLNRELALLGAEHKQRLTRLETEEAERQTSSRQRQHEDDQRALQSSLEQHRSRRQTLSVELTTVVAQWKSGLSSARQLASVSRDEASVFPGWERMKQLRWVVPGELPGVIPVGVFSADFPAHPDRGLMESGEHQRSVRFEFPALLRFPVDTSIVVQHDVAGREVALDFIRAILLRLLTSVIPGRIQFTLIDPAGLGQSFSAMMHLADFDELLISNRIWTDAAQIRDRLQKVTEHMESVFQTYLRSEFETIEEYNRAAGEVAEPYHFVVIAGFPAGFTEEAAKHLTAILTSGPRCGVHTILAWSPDQPLPRNFPAETLQQCARQFVVRQEQVLPRGMSVAGAGRLGDASVASVDDLRQPGELAGKPEQSNAVRFAAMTAPDAGTYVNLVRLVGEQSRDARRVEVSFSRIAPRPDVVWGLSTAEGVDLPIGRAGAARLQYLRLGRGPSQHGLIAGTTGSGKSTLMHILVTNLALYYSPAEIEFYLIDFKKGVEFRTYAACGLPHARVVAIESDREFGLSVLERLEEILQERGDMFRARGVQDVPAFRRQFPGEAMPRVLLMIDEFQEFFTSEDRVSARAALVLDRLIRQGRAFGIHVILGSQTLGGAYSLARSTLGQVAIRIALQCSESDAHLILSEDNSAARLLTRPGEAIYNDANGMVEGNHPFQIAWLDEEKREALLSPLRARPGFAAEGRAAMVVFEGNVAPRIEQCAEIQSWMSAADPELVGSETEMPVWVGAPVAIADPVCVRFQRTGGQNLLIVGQESDVADALLASAAGSCCLSHRRGLSADVTAQLILLHDGRDRVSWQRFSESEFAACGHGFQLCDAAETDAVVEALWNRMTARETQGTADGEGTLLLAIRNLGQFRTLRRDDDDFGLGSFGAAKEMTTASRLGELIKKGPLVGIHVLLWADTFSNALRWLSTSLLREFDSRVVFRLNQTDSASLIDTPAAAALPPGRAILYRDQTGSAERFRPFGWPTGDWLRGLSTAETIPGERVETVSHDRLDRSNSPSSEFSDDLPDIDQLLIE